MTDADIQALAEAVGLHEPVDDVVAWARARTDALLASGLDDDLVELLAGRGDAQRIAVRPLPRTPEQDAAPASERAAEPINGRSRPVAEAAEAPAPRDEERGSSATRLPLPPLPPLPQRPDLAASAGDSADDLEMLDEEDLELVEDVAEDGGDEAERTPEVSSPEWKRALADAQGE
jgi:hypothetical protein